MQVKDRMTANPVTVNEDTPFEEALHLMREKKIRRLPVLGKDGRLVGMVVEKDLYFASPSAATTLSTYEVHYLLSKLKMKELMTKRVIAVGEDCPLEEAARIMVDNKIGSLPILREGRLVGIITETDIFKTFVEILGGREGGMRLTLDVTEGKGVLLALTSAILNANGNIVSLATFSGRDLQDRIITIKVTEANQELLLEGLKATGVEVLNAVDTTKGGYEPIIVGEKARPAARG